MHATGRLLFPALRWRVDTGLTVNVESAVPAGAVAELKARGHGIQQASWWSTDFGRAQLIYKLEDGNFGASERRTDGQAVGY